MVNRPTGDSPVGGMSNVWSERDILAEAEALVHLGAWQWEVDADSVWWSDETYRIFGLVPQQFPATLEGFLNSVHPDDRAMQRQKVSEALEKGDEHDFRYRVVRPTGEVRHVHEHGRVTRDRDGSPVRMLGTVRDITAEVQLQQERDEAIQVLADREEQYRLLAQNAWDVVWTMTPDGDIAYVSPSLERLSGLTPDEAVAQHYDRFHPPQAAARWAEYLARLDSALARGTSPPKLHEEMEYYAKEGSIRVGEIQATPQLDQDGHLLQIVGVTRDVTQRRQYEEALVHEAHRVRSILDGMLDPWVMFEPIRDERDRIVDFVFSEANVRACEYNQMSREQMIGASLLTLLPGHRGSELFASYVRVIESGDPLVLDDFSYPREIYRGEPRRYDIRAVRVDGGMSYTWRDVTARYESKQRIEQSEHRFAAALESEIDPHVFLEAIRDGQGNLVDLRYVAVNPAAQADLGMSEAQLRDTTFCDIGWSGFDQSIEALAAVIDTGETLKLDAWLADRSRAPGRYLDVRAVKAGDGISVIWRDVTETVKAQRALADSEERYRLLSMSASELVVLIRDHRIAWASPSALNFFGTDEDEAVGVDARILIHPDDLEIFDNACTAAEAGESRVVRLRASVDEGEQYWLEMHAGPYIDARGQRGSVLTSSRVIDHLIDMERELEYRAKYDLLTGLMNRSEAMATVARLSGQRQRTGGRNALLFCDIDLFKVINDDYGHAAGDQVLRTIATRLTDSIRSDDVAARLGGDELLVFLAGVHSREEALGIAEKIHDAATRPIVVGDGKQIEPGLSVGVTLAREAETTDELLERADKAMYQAKSEGRNRVVAID